MSHADFMSLWHWWSNIKQAFVLIRMDYFTVQLLNKHLVVNWVLKGSRFYFHWQMKRVLLSLTKDCRIKCIGNLWFDSEAIWEGTNIYCLLKKVSIVRFYLYYKHELQMCYILTITQTIFYKKKKASSSRFQFSGKPFWTEQLGTSAGLI